MDLDENSLFAIAFSAGGFDQRAPPKQPPPVENQEFQFVDDTYEAVQRTYGPRDDRYTEAFTLGSAIGRGGNAARRLVRTNYITRNASRDHRKYNEHKKIREILANFLSDDQIEDCIDLFSSAVQSQVVRGQRRIAILCHAAVAAAHPRILDIGKLLGVFRLKDSKFKKERKLFEILAPNTLKFENSLGAHVTSLLADDDGPRKQRIKALCAEIERHHLFAEKLSFFNPRHVAGVVIHTVLPDQSIGAFAMSKSTEIKIVKKMREMGFFT